MKNFKKVALASVAAAALLASGSVMAKAAGHNFNGMGRCDFNKLQLTDAQKKQLRSLRDERKDARSANEEQQRAEWTKYRTQVNELIRQKNFDDRKAKALIQAQQEKSIDMQLSHLKARHAFFQVLDEKQQQIWLKECAPSDQPFPPPQKNKK
ncbi:Spy/CpxP family protein refolding chaperone [Neisseria sp. Ec49-e6-T10]|uniref:Spy/CpxP family protein refolding chaperone n=1 Tax=Neisseria sp. Ec49-e6-T10 TaxID=3140744 RepID=UPI003EBCF091